jgi:S1-C subfamily serine protease
LGSAPLSSAIPSVNNGEKVISIEDLQILLETKYQVGDKVIVTILRGSQKIPIMVTLTEEPARQ